MWRRLTAARDAADSVGGALVFHGREERILEAMYVAFPHLRPSDDIKVELYKGPTKPTKAELARRAREDARRNSTSARIGGAAGTMAADRIELDRTHQKAQRVDNGGDMLSLGGGV